MDVDRVVELARLAVLRSSGFISAWEFDWDTDAQTLHKQLREALGISEEEYLAQL